MTILRKLLFTAWLLAAMLPGAAQDYDVYLCIGQSNMAGRGDMVPGDEKPLEGVFLLNDEGVPVPAAAPLNIYSTIRKKAWMQGINPAWSFSQKMHAATGRPVLLVVNAKGGTGIDLWVKDAPCDTFRVSRGDEAAWDGKPTPQFYAEAVRRTRQAMQYGSLKGILWHQGEGDSGSDKKRDSYIGKLSGLVADLRADLDAPDVPFVAGEVCHRGHGEKINQTLMQIAYFVPNSCCVSADGLGMRADNVHFTREAQIELGERYADAFLNREYEAKTLYVKARNPYYHQWIMYPCRTVESIGMKDSAPDKLNKYGSLAKGGPRFARTGFFHVQKHKGRWVMVDPEGKQHIETALVSVQPGKGKIQYASLKEKYVNADNWRNSVPKELLSLGFNGNGAWSDIVMTARFNGTYDKQKYTYYVFLGLMSGYAKELKVARSLPGHTGFPGDCILVFDPGFEKYCDSRIRKMTEKCVDDPCLVGYFSDNELPFGSKNLEGYLSLPEKDYGRKEALRWLAAKGVDVSAQLLPEGFEKPRKLDGITDELRREFAGYVAEAYYSTVLRVLRRYDKNHMYVGSRFHGPVFREEEVIRAAGRYCDVVSYNFYERWDLENDYLRDWDAWTGKPFMVTEFYTKGMDSGLPNTRGAGWRVSSQKDRAAHYQNFCIKLLESDSCVGWHFFKYQDNDPTDTTTDPSNRDSNKGIVSNRYEYYTDLVDAMKELNLRRYGIWRKFHPAK